MKPRWGRCLRAARPLTRYYPYNRYTGYKTPLRLGLSLSGDARVVFALQLKGALQELEELLPRGPRGGGVVLPFPGPKSARR